MTARTDLAAPADSGMAAPHIWSPLTIRPFRAIWIGGLFANLGWMIGVVGAGWLMVRLNADPQNVALVQTAQTAPFLVISLVGGAIADMRDTRHIIALCILFNLATAALLTALALAGLLTRGVLLVGMAMIGSGVAFLLPAWQASVRELVPPALLPTAIALNSISLNAGRSVGPALGGLVVSVSGGGAAFVLNAVCYLPLLCALRRWPQGERSLSRQGGLFRAISAGLQYAAKARTMRTVLVRALLFALGASSLTALLPLVAHDILARGAETFGFLLGSFGIGGIAGALSVSRLRRHMGPDAILRLLILCTAAGIVIVAVSSSAALTALAVAACGASWVLSNNELGLAMQTHAPHWALGRMLAFLGAVLAGGMALGGWAWGALAAASSVSTALILSAGGLMVLLIGAGWLQFSSQTETEA